jgi:hypothetical protein
MLSTSTADGCRFSLIKGQRCPGTLFHMPFPIARASFDAQILLPPSWTAGVVMAQFAGNGPPGKDWQTAKAAKIAALLRHPGVDQYAHRCVMVLDSSAAKRMVLRRRTKGRMRPPCLEKLVRRIHGWTGDQPRARPAIKYCMYVCISSKSCGTCVPSMLCAQFRPCIVETPVSAVTNAAKGLPVPSLCFALLIRECQVDDCWALITD